MTFADKLKELREKATPGDYAANANYATFVMSHAADIEALVRAAQGMNEIMGPCDHIDGDGNCQAHFVEANCTAKALRQALAALEGKK